MTTPLILITNDDGIDSPGLQAAATAVADLGELLIMAPATQQTGTGRSYPPPTDKTVYETTVLLDGESHAAYKAHFSPAQAVSAAVYDLAARPIDLCVSGINYGENVGSGVTISGTVGAAIEAASHGIPSLAVSLETPVAYHRSHNPYVDFSTAAHFTRYFAIQLLRHGLPDGADLLKIDLPDTATPDTPWRSGCVSRQRYYQPIPRNHPHAGKVGAVSYQIGFDPDLLEPNSDIKIVAIDRQISVVPMTFDLTVSAAVDEVTRLYTTTN